MSERLSTEASTAPVAAAIVAVSMRRRSAVSERETTHPRIAPKPRSPIRPKLASASAHKGTAAPVPGTVTAWIDQRHSWEGLVSRDELGHEEPRQLEIRLAEEETGMLLVDRRVGRGDVYGTRRNALQAGQCRMNWP